MVELRLVINFPFSVDRSAFNRTQTVSVMILCEEGQTRSAQHRLSDEGKAGERTQHVYILRSRDRSVFDQTNIDFVSRTTFGGFLGNREERVWLSERSNATMS